MFSLEDILASISFWLFFVYRQIYPPTRITRPVIDSIDENPQSIGSVPTPSSSTNVHRRSVRLPNETLDYIFSFYVASLVHDLRCGTVRDCRVRRKHFMQDLCRVARCSRLFYQVMGASLRRTWALCNRDSSSVPCITPTPGIWIITAGEGSLPLDFNLAPFQVLEIASINYHGGIEWSPSQRQFRRFRCIAAYPRSLRQLEILRLHAPEEEVIRLISDCCPGLTELRLVRCTMFNDPKCWYWRVHARNQDHDYMRSHDPVAVVDFANHMAHLLRGLPMLESIHIGHYLISINAVFTHRTDQAHKRYHHPITDKLSHIDGIRVVSTTQLMATSTDSGPPINPRDVCLADRKLWAQPCPQCEQDYREPIEIAERLAAGIMAAHFRNLKHVSFASFLSDKRIGPSSWLVGRQYRDQDLHVRTEDPNRPRSRVMQEVVLVGNRWEPPQMI